MGKAFDVIVMGARCAGSPTAMLLARRGYRVLAVDRASFPSDTVSTHLVHPRAVNALSRWGLLDRLVATGCPPIHTYAFDFGAFTIAGAPGMDKDAVAYCPRRTILDKLLVDAAAESGAEIRQGFVVEEIIIEGERVVGIKGRSKQGGAVTEYAEIIVGADGRHSMLSEAVHPEQYREKPPLLAGYYSYWRGLPTDGRFETYIRDRRAFAAMPTHDDLTLVIAGWPYAEFAENRKDIEGNYLKAIEQAPDFAKRLRSATREAPFAGAAVPNYFRKPYGPGWALVGDAGYNRDFVTAQGILDAFRDAELCASGNRPIIVGRAAIRGSHGRVPAHPRRGRRGDVRFHLRPRNARAAATRTATDPWRGSRQPGRHGRLCASECRDDIADGIFCA